MITSKVCDVSKTRHIREHILMIYSLSLSLSSVENPCSIAMVSIGSACLKISLFTLNIQGPKLRFRAKLRGRPCSC